MEKTHRETATATSSSLGTFPHVDRQRRHRTHTERRRRLGEGLRIFENLSKLIPQLVHEWGEDDPLVSYLTEIFHTPVDEEFLYVHMVAAEAAVRERLAADRGNDLQLPRKARRVKLTGDRNSWGAFPPAEMPLYHSVGGFLASMQFASIAAFLRLLEPSDTELLIVDEGDESGWRVAGVLTDFRRRPDAYARIWDQVLEAFGEDEARRGALVSYGRAFRGGEDPADKRLGEDWAG